MAKWTVWCQPKMGIFLVLLCSIRHSRGHPDIYHVRPKDGSRVIQPYSCHDPETKEEGVCMFSWNCQRSNGTHLTYCMDRFYFGSCCRLPPGVYIATPPPVISNEVTLAQKQKLKPSTTPTIRLTTTEPSTSKRWPTEEKRVPSSTSSSTVFTKQTQTEFPPGLVTWRPKGESSSTPAPVKRKPTKIFSTKPLLASSTAEPGTTEGSKLFSLDSTISTRPTTPSTSATTVTRRRTRPTRPYGSNNPKRKTRPTRPYPVRNATASGVTRRKTKPTRPSYRPTTPSSSISTDVERPTTRATIGTWSNILDQSTRPLPFTRKTTPSSATRNTPRPTRITAATRPPSVRPTQTTRQPTSRPTQTTATHPSSARPTQTTATRPSAARPTQALATRLSTSRPTQATATRLSTSRPTQTAATRPPTAKPVRLTTTTRPTTKPTRTIVTRPSTTRPTRPPTARPTHISVETTSRRSTVDTTPPRRRTKPTRPQYSSTTVPTRPSTVRAPLPSRKPEVTTRTTEPPVKSTFEIITFPPFPGVFGLPTKAPSTISPISDVRTTTTFKPKTTVKKPTSSITYPSTTEWSTQAPTTEHSTTTEKITPGQDHSKVCGKPNPGPVGRIVGGGNSFFGEWPWVVSLRQWKKNAFLHKCGATLLNEFWAITAAHCVENVPLTDILLRLGEYDISHENEPLPFVERRVQIVASHPQFDRRTFEYDLALLRFYEPITFQRNILPICIPAGNDTYVGKYATVTGWGRLYEDGPLPDVIQEVSLPIITNKLCENMYRQAGFVEDIPDIFICAGYGDGGKDSCEGDSGGPMVLQEDDGRWVLAGVISWGIGCALPNQPGVYTRITKFSEWINQIIIF